MLEPEAKPKSVILILILFDILFIMDMFALISFKISLKYNLSVLLMAVTCWMGALLAFSCSPRKGEWKYLSGWYNLRKKI